MPRQIQSIPVTFANTGIVLKSAADEIPITAYMALVNVFTDRENSLTVRKGFTRLNDGLPSGNFPCSAYFLRDINGRQWRYAVANGTMYVAPVEAPGDPAVWPLAYGTNFQPIPGGTGLSTASDPRPIWANYTLIGLEYKPYIFMADGTVFLKHKPGDGTTADVFAARRVGIPKPEPLVDVALADNNQVLVEDFDDKTLWTADSSSLTTEGGWDGLTNALGIQLATPGDDKVFGAYKAITAAGYPQVLDMDLGDPNGVIEIWVRFANEEAALNCQEITLAFGLSETVGDISFSTRYEKAIKPSEFEAAAQPGSAGRTASYNTSMPTANTDLNYRNARRNYGDDSNVPSDIRTARPASNQGWVEDPSIYYDPKDQFTTGQPVSLRPGGTVWNRIRISKTDFTRVGESVLTAPLLDWQNVSAIRIDIKTIETCVGGKTCWAIFDICNVIDGKLYGIDYKYAITYYNSKTGTESDYSDPVTADKPVESGQFDLTFPICPDTTPPKADPDKIRIYRQGGTSQYYRKLPDEIDYTPGAVPAVYRDNNPDSDQGDVLNTDNQLPPDGVKGCIMWDDRLWVWGGRYTTEDGTVVEEPPNRLRFSKAVTVENFPVQTNYVYVGTGSEQIQNCLEHDGELFVFTLTKVFRIVGSSGVYRAVGTAVNQGLKSPHGLTRGVRSVYMHSYDGIYEFPSGRKISEVINPVFFNETSNQLPPIYLGRESETAMGFWDNKVYFSYPTTPVSSGLGNDVTLVWDTIYERWHWYMYGAQDLFTEPENNILVGSNLVQWDQVLDGDFSGQHFSGPWTMRLENGYADQCNDPEGFRGIFWAVDTKDYDLGMPDQEKRFFDFVMDADTQGTTVALQVAWDIAKPDFQDIDNPYEEVGTFQTIGRQRTILPVLLGEGDSKLATRCALRIIATTEATATGYTRIFKVVHRILPEPLRHRTFVTDWSDYGTPGPKFFRELWVEMDTFGLPLERIEVQVDQGVAQVLTPIAGVSGQQKLYFGLVPDLRGTLARLKFVPSGDNEIKVWDHNFQVMGEPPQINTIQTPWTHEGWPYPKLWKEVLLDIDTAGLPMHFSFWLDGKVKENFTVQTLNGRERVTYSLEKDSFGKLGRLTLNEDFYDFNCCLPQGVRFYGVEYVIDKDPADVSFSDSYDYLWSFPRLKVLRRFWISIKNPDSDVTMEVYMDETLKHTEVIAAEPRSTGFSKRRIDLESAIKGRLVRVIFSSTFPFQLYWERSEWELKDLNTEDGYRREQMVPPQTL
jgi:hypothetical protein